jgi:Tfp pilus assembly PilM family ATPase
MTLASRVPALLEQVVSAPRALARALSRWMPDGGISAVTVLSLDGQWLKVLHAEGPGPARRITRAFAAPVAGAGPEDIQKTFRETCQTEGFAPGATLIAVPTHLCTARLFSLPSVEPKEIRDIVELQAEKHTPYAREEILSDFRIIERDRAGYSRVLLAIAHQDVVHRPVRLVETLGLNLDRVAAELEGLIAWCRLARPAGKGPAAEAALVVDMDGGTTTLLVMQRGHPTFQRSLAMGAEQLADDPVHTAERLVVEVQRSLEALETEWGLPRVQEVIITGSPQGLAELKPTLERGLELPVRLAPSWEQMPLAGPAAAAIERLPAVSFTGLLGLALGPEPEINLTPQPARLRQAFEARARELVLLGCQALGVLLLASILLISRAQKAESHYAALQRLHAGAAPPAEEVERALGQLEFVKTQLRQRGQLLDAVAVLAAQTPGGTRWNALTFTRGEALVLKGTSATLPQVYEFAAALRTAGAFAEVETARVAKRPDQEEGITDFELRCVLRGAAGT